MKYISYALLLIAAMTSGCGKPARPLSPITGKVTYHGKPLRFGAIVLQPEYGQFATGIIQSDGSFQMATTGEGRGVPLGKNKVCITCFEGQDPAVQASAAKGGPPREHFRGKSLIPPKYQSFETSGVTVDVRPGVNEPLVLELKD